MRIWNASMADITEGPLFLSSASCWVWCFKAGNDNDLHIHGQRPPDQAPQEIPLSAVAVITNIRQPAWKLLSPKDLTLSYTKANAEIES